VSRACSTLATVKVFLVEDSPLLRSRLETMLASIPGATLVGHASGAREAIDAIDAAGPDIVVLDIHLDEGNGFDVLRAMQHRSPRPAVYVLTNFPGEAYRRTAERLGARGFFDKTNEFERLKASLAAAGLPPE
jgi:two-component system, NarL family, response regulator DevR